MDCDKEIACELVEINQGSRKILTVKILDANDVGQDMTGVTNIEAAFPAAISGQFVTKTAADAVDPIEIISGTSNVKVTLGASNTQQLKAGKNQMFFLKITFPGSLGVQVFRVSPYTVHEVRAFA
jgi:hypothetical protein